MKSAGIRRCHSLGRYCLAIIFVFTTMQCGQAAAQTAKADGRITQILELLGRTRTPMEAAISPDGSYVAWTVGGAGGAELHLTAIAGAGTSQKAPDRTLSPDTIGNKSNSAPSKCGSRSPVWSPDGKTLAFVSNCNIMGEAQKQSQIWLWTLSKNAVKQLTNVKGSISTPVWSPDGKAIAFLFVENATRSMGAVNAENLPSGVIGEDGVEVQRVSVADVETGGVYNLSPTNLHAYEFDWAPNSHELAYVAAAPPGENNWWVAQLYTQPWLFGGKSGSVNMEAATKATSILNTQTISGPLHGLQIAVPRWSPDGKQIAFIGGIMSDQGSTGGDIYLISSTGGEPKNLTPGRTASPAWLQWTGPEQIELTEHAGGSTHIAFLNTQTGKDDPDASFTIPGSVGDGRGALGLSVVKGGEAFILSSFNKPPEVFAAAGTAPHAITHLNDGLKPLWGKTEDIEWMNEGFHVQGWLLYPVNYDATKKYPLIVSVHGGPSSAVTPRWPAVGYGPVPFSALGYFVLMPNPRGSYGQGEKFTQANVKDFGYGDLRDILAGVDAVEKKFPIDDKRVGITGWSYGGYMTMFAVTQTNRFKAAVAGAGLANWQSYYGENSIDQWMIPFFGASVYDDPKVYEKSSPMTFIKNVKTPTLMVVGDRDGECPMPQSFEFWHALRDLGVKTELVVYPNEGHHFSSAEHRRDVMERALQWFEQEMP